MIGRILGGVAMLALAAASPAFAQSSSEATLFGKGNFRDPAVVLSGPRENLGPIQVESLKLSPGSAWELCSGRTFSGCKRFSESRRSMVITVRSARPIEGAIPESASAAFGTAPLKGSGKSLRGLASEFFVMPDEGGSRVEVGSDAVLPQRATEFCHAHGWGGSPYQREQSVGGRNYLADVLCSNAER
jgi:hypothetical protein